MERKNNKYKKKVKEKWNLIYNIRNEIEHPKELKTTCFFRENGKVVIPKIIYKSKNYDLLELAEDSLICVYIFFKTIMWGSFLHSKYVKLCTDESKQIWYRVD